MGSEIQRAPEVNLLKSEVEAAAARVFERAANNTVDGATSFIGDVFGGAVGDAVRQWRTRRLVTGLAVTKDHLDKLGVPIENAKCLPMGELYAIFDGMSKQEDPHLTSMWAALLANAMNPDSKFVIDPSLPKILDQISGVDAVILNFYDEAIEERNLVVGDDGGSYHYGSREKLEKFRSLVEKKGNSIIENFGEEIVSSSISNLLRLGLLYVENSYTSRDDLITVETSGDMEFSVDTRILSRELSNIYYHLDLSYDNVLDHKIIDYFVSGSGKIYFLPYESTRLAKRLVKACS